MFAFNFYVVYFSTRSTIVCCIEKSCCYSLKTQILWIFLSRNCYMLKHIASPVFQPYFSWPGKNVSTDIHETVITQYLISGWGYLGSIFTLVLGIITLPCMKTKQNKTMLVLKVQCMSECMNSRLWISPFFPGVTGIGQGKSALCLDLSKPSG